MLSRESAVIEGLVRVGAVSFAPVDLKSVSKLVVLARHMLGILP